METLFGPAEKLTLLQGVSPVRTLATLATLPELKGRNLDCGENSTESFAAFDRDSFSWRTCQLCLTGDSEEFSETWPRAGSMQNGTAFRHVPLVPHTTGTECSSWVRFSTPRANEGGPPSESFRASVPSIAEIERDLGQKTSLQWQEWMMGFPIGWTDVSDLETP